MCTRFWIRGALMLVLAGATALTPTYAQNPFDQLKKAIEAARKPKVPAATPVPPATPMPGSSPAAAPAGGAGEPFKGKVQESPMGPMLGGPGVMARTSMSEDGDHLAIVTSKGSRQVVLIDGVEGPVFDEIPSVFFGMVQVSVQFSPTGGHSGYLGRRGGDLVAVIDGKEAGVVATSQTGTTVSGANGWSFLFNQDGSHIAYAGYIGSNNWQMVADGVKSPSYREIDFRQTFLRGKRVAYVAQTADQQWHAVVDGKAGPGYNGINSLQLTPDGAHYAYIAFPVGSAKSIVVADGVETGQSYKGVGDLELAPDGRVAYMAATATADPGAHGGGAGMLVVAGIERPGSCGKGVNPSCMTFPTRPPAYMNINSPQRHVAWSPDGKGVAWVQSNAPDPGITVMVNGKPMGMSYSYASELRFSPDGRRFAYLGSAQTGFFQVIDGQEMQAASDVPEFRWSPDGKRYAFQANGTLIVDGKEMPKPKGAGVTRDSFIWSPDGKHFAYAASFQFLGESPVVDGEVKPVYLGTFQGTNRIQPMIAFPPFLFSPDGNHLAFVGYTYDAQGRGNGLAAVMVDGVRQQAPTPNYAFPAFSPDGRHFATVVTGNSGWAAMVDGKMSPSYEDIVLQNVAAARFVDDHTYRFYGIKAGQIYRVTLDVAN